VPARIGQVFQGSEVFVGDAPVHGDGARVGTAAT
jgi:hypothetical protein